MLKPSAISLAIAAAFGGLSHVGPAARTTQAAPQKRRMTSKTPEQQREDFYAAEFRRQQRYKRNLRRVGIEPKSEEGEL